MAADTLIGEALALSPYAEVTAQLRRAVALLRDIRMSRAPTLKWLNKRDGLLKEIKG